MSIHVAKKNFGHFLALLHLTEKKNVEKDHKSWPDLYYKFLFNCFIKNKTDFKSEADYEKRKYALEKSKESQKLKKIDDYCYAGGGIKIELIFKGINKSLPG